MDINLHSMDSMDINLHRQYGHKLTQTVWS